MADEEEKVPSLRDQVINLLAILQTPMGPAKLGIKSPEQIPLKLLELQVCSTISLSDEVKRIADLLEIIVGKNSSPLHLGDFESRIKRMKEDAEK